MRRYSLQTSLLAMAAFAVGAVLLFFTIQTVSAASSFSGGATESGGHVVLVSDTSNVSASDDYSGVSFDDANGTTFASLSNLSADFDVTDDSCGGGSPRFQVGVDTNGDSVSDGNVHIAFGPSPSFAGCTGGWQSTGNMIGNEDAGRYDYSAFGGSPFTTYSAAPASVLSGTITSIRVIVDGSWSAAASGGDSEQTVHIDNVAVNSNTYSFPEAAEDVTVTIVKQIDGETATAESADGASFPMTATWDADNLGSGSGSFALSPTGFNNPDAYKATTAEMTAGADYSVTEQTDTMTVGANCDAGQAYRMVGYTYGDTPEDAAAGEMSSTVALTDIQTNKFIYVWNETCVPTPTHVYPANGSATTTAGQTYVDWSDVSNNVGGMTYIYQSSNASTTNPDGSFTSPAYTSGPLASSTIATAGTPNGTYYWHVMATDGNGNTSSWSTPWTFIVSDSETPPTETATSTQVTIMKRINGVPATATNASSSTFTMNATWNDDGEGGIGSGTGTYTLSSTTDPAYQAQTIEFMPGADYSTSEVLGTNVGATCAAGKPYALDGYTTGDTMQAAASSTATTTAPSFTDMQTDKYVIVWNKTCGDTIGGDVVGSGELQVTSIDSVDTTATADNSYENGWSYVFHITVPTDETNIAMKFSNWTSGSSTIPVANNMRISSMQADNGNAPITVTAEDTYTIPDLHMVTDLDPVLAGIQTQIKVDVKIPVGTTNGSYTTNYGVRSQ